MQKSHKEKVLCDSRGGYPQLVIGKWIANTYNSDHDCCQWGVKKVGFGRLTWISCVLWLLVGVNVYIKASVKPSSSGLNVLSFTVLKFKTALYMGSADRAEHGR